MDKFYPVKDGQERQDVCVFGVVGLIGFQPAKQIGISENLQTCRGKVKNSIQVSPNT